MDGDTQREKCGDDIDNNAAGKNNTLDWSKTRCIQTFQPRDMMENFPDADHKKNKDCGTQKGICDFISSLEESAKKENVENGINQKNIAEIGKIGIHHRIGNIGRCVGEECHAKNGENCHQQKCDELNENRKNIFGTNHIAFGNRQHGGVECVIGFACRLKGLKHAETNKECSHEDRVAGNQCHK